MVLDQSTPWHRSALHLSSSSLHLFITPFGVGVWVFRCFSVSVFRCFGVCHFLSVFCDSNANLQERSNPVNTFAFTFYGPVLHPSLLHSLRAKAHDSCNDCNELKYSLLYTSKPKRAGWIESVITNWNEQQASENAKIKLFAVEFEPKIVTKLSPPMARLSPPRTL